MEQQHGHEGGGARKEIFIDFGLIFEFFFERFLGTEAGHCNVFVRLVSRSFVSVSESNLGRPGLVDQVCAWEVLQKLAFL